MTERARRIESAFERLVERGFNGVALVDVEGAPRIFSAGMADREAGVAVTDDTVFDIGSVTKQFTAAGILRLQMDGALSVVEPLGTYVPALPSDKSDITLHQLLTHTAGLPDSFGDDYERLDRESFLSRLRTAELIGEPGAAYAYSNVGYSALAAVIEIASGMSYEGFLADRLFRPAGMHSTGYVMFERDRARLAVGYLGDLALGRPDEQPWSGQGPHWNLLGNGGLLSTAGDMYRWHAALLTDDVLDRPAKASMYERHTDEGADSGTYYGYGWALFPTVFDTTLVTHDGGNGVFFADFLRFLEEGVTIFVATNAADPALDTAAYGLAEAVFDTDLLTED